jgi:SH3 domain protein
MRWYLYGLAAATLAVAEAAGAAYITDKLLIGVRESPQTAAKSGALLQGGAPVEVLKREGDYLQVRAPDGTLGWVESRYVTEEKPATQLLLDAQARNGELARKVQELESRVAAAMLPTGGIDPKQVAEMERALGLARERIRQLEAEPIDALRKEVEALRARVARAVEALGAEMPQPKSAAGTALHQEPAVWGAGAALLGIGFVLGRIVRRRPFGGGRWEL